jgi:gliding motility associated protien GldN
MKKETFLYSLLFAVSVMAMNAQVLAPYKYVPNTTPEDDGLIPKHDLHQNNNRVVPYSFLRQDDMMWSTRHWEEIHIHEKINQGLYYPIEDLPDRVALFNVLLNGINEGSITEVFDNDIFTQPLTPQEILNKLYTIKEKKNEFGEVVIRDSLFVVPANVISWKIKSDWYFDKQRGEMKSRIIGICPVVQKDWEADAEDLFWIWFPDTRKALSQNLVYNPENNNRRMTFDQLFQMRYFNAVVIKEDNMYDRSITDYYKVEGRETLLESRRIREELRDYESSLWQY